MPSLRAALRSPSPPALRYALVALIVVGLRLPTVDQAVVDWDESVYVVVAQDLVEGGRLYDTVWDHKGPLLYAALAPVVAAAGGDMAPVRWYATVWVLAAMLFADLIVRRACSADWSFVGALAYGLFFSVPRFGGLAANGELFMMLPATVAVWLAVCWTTAGGLRWRLAASGLFAVAAVLIKTTAIFTVATIPVLILVARGSRLRSAWRAIAADVAAFAAPPVLAFLAVLGWFAATDRLSDYLFATFGFNSAYIASVPFLESWRRFAAFFAWAGVGDLLTAIAVVGAVYLTVHWSRTPVAPWLKALVIALSGFSFLGVIAGRNLYFHYYLQMALPLSVVIAVFCASLGIAVGNWRRLAWIALALGVVSSFSPHRFGGEGLTREPGHDQVLAEVAAFIRASGRPEDHMYVLGGQPVLYYLCQRDAPTRYFFWLYLTDRWDAILGSREEALKALHKDPPEWFVYLPREPRVPEVEQLMFERYTLVREVGNYQVARLASQ